MFNYLVIAFACSYLSCNVPVIVIQMIFYIYAYAHICAYTTCCCTLYWPSYSVILYISDLEKFLRTCCDHQSIRICAYAYISTVYSCFQVLRCSGLMGLICFWGLIFWEFANVWMVHWTHEQPWTQKGTQNIVQFNFKSGIQSTHCSSVGSSSSSI